MPLQSLAECVPAIGERIESTLERAERQLAELREQMQPHCSEQQKNIIR